MGGSLRALSKTAKQMMLQMETYAKFPYLIEVELNDGTILRYANSENPIEYLGNIYQPTFFKIKPPDRTNTSIGNGNITFSCIDQKWIEYVRTQKERCNLKFLACIIYDSANNIERIEQIDEMNFKLTEAQWTDTSIQFTLLFDDKMEVLIPCDSATSFKTPAVV